MFIECIPSMDPSKKMCPYIGLCEERINDPTIAGCSFPLCMDGIVAWEDGEVLLKIGGSEYALYQLEKDNG